MHLTLPPNYSCLGSGEVWVDSVLDTRDEEPCYVGYERMTTIKKLEPGEHEISAVTSFAILGEDHRCVWSGTRESRLRVTVVRGEVPDLVKIGPAAPYAGELVVTSGLDHTGSIWFEARSLPVPLESILEVRDTAGELVFDDVISLKAGYGHGVPLSKLNLARGWHILKVKLVPFPWGALYSSARIDEILGPVEREVTVEIP
jgi:hypothetical protein